MSHRELSKAYKERQRAGGVYRIVNTSNGRYILGHAADLASARNRFQFALTTGSSVDSRLRGDWQAFGSAAFSMETLAELEQREGQTLPDFMAELETLEELTRAQLDPSLAY